MIDIEYQKAYEKCLNDLKKDFKIYREGGVLYDCGSNYDYLACIGKFYFTHRDFAQALVSGKHGFYAFSRDSALKYIKKYKKDRYEHYKNCRYLYFKENNNDIFTRYYIA